MRLRGGEGWRRKAGIAVLVAVGSRLLHRLLLGCWCLRLAWLVAGEEVGVRVVMVLLMRMEAVFATGLVQMEERRLGFLVAISRDVKVVEGVEEVVLLEKLVRMRFGLLFLLRMALVMCRSVDLAEAGAIGLHWVKAAQVEVLAHSKMEEEVVRLAAQGL